MKQTIDLGEYTIIIKKTPGIKDILIPNHSTNEYGIYIALSDGTLIKPSDYKEGVSTEGVVLHTAHASIVISKFDHPKKLTHDEAVKIGVFSRHEAIEYDVYKKEVSAALVMICGKPLINELYWLQEDTECPNLNAWLYGGSLGNLHYNYKYYSHEVRQVSALKDFLSSF